MACNYSHDSVTSLLVLSLMVLVLSLSSHSCNGFGKFGLDIHHRFSDPVTEILGIGDDELLPHKGTPQYYAAMVHRDRVFHGRRLAGDRDTPITFAAGNETHQIAAFGLYDNSSPTSCHFSISHFILNFLLLVFFKRIFFYGHNIFRNLV